jgi:glycine/D-amino acid oxidase-like deaminating enzyme
VKDYSRVSYWLETAGDDLRPRDPLDGSTEVDVAILGAGYTGLWTAYYLLKKDPTLRIAILEAEIAGFGGSGRNGAWCSAHSNLSPWVIADRYGPDAARHVQRLMNETVDEIGRVIAEEGIDAGYMKGGAIHVARGSHQVPLAHGQLEKYARLGLGDQYELLDASETAARVRVERADCSLFTRHCATLHPGRLVRGLARLLEARRVRIYERTPVTGFRPGPPKPVLVTRTGEVRANTVVLAGEGYLTRLRALHRQLVPVYSLIVLTEPLSSETWRAIGWQARECMSSFRLTIDYLSRTADGRILFGGRGAPYHFGSRIEDAFDRDAATHEMLARMLVDWFPAAAGARITHRWGGVVAAARDWTPTISYDKGTGIATARGYLGQGVATTNLAARALADLINGERSPATDLPYVNHRSPNWEPEPFRWLGVRFVQLSYAWLDARAERTGRPPSGRSLAERIADH